MKNYEKYMRQCFKLALKAEGKTSPNPLVGCVVLDKTEKVIEITGTLPAGVSVSYTNNKLTNVGTV